MPVKNKHCNLKQLNYSAFEFTFCFSIPLDARAFYHFYSYDGAGTSVFLQQVLTIYLLLELRHFRPADTLLPIEFGNQHYRTFHLIQHLQHLLLLLTFVHFSSVLAFFFSFSFCFLLLFVLPLNTTRSPFLGPAFKSIQCSTAMLQSHFSIV